MIRTVTNSKYSSLGSKSHTDRRFKPTTLKAKKPLAVIGFDDDYSEPITLSPDEFEGAIVDAMVAEYDSRDYSGFEGVRF